MKSTLLKAILVFAIAALLAVFLIRWQGGGGGGSSTLRGRG